MLDSGFIYSVAIVHIIAIIISIIFIVTLYHKAQKGPLLYTLIYVTLNMIVWMSAKVLKTVSPNVYLRWYFIVLQYLAISLLEVSFVEFSYCYAFGKRIPNKIRKLLYIFPIIQFIIVMTNPMHMMFYSYYDFWTDDFGMVFYISFIIEYCYIVCGIFMCGKKLRSLLKERKRIYVMLVSTAIVMPLIVNVLFITDVLDEWFMLMGIDIFDITPIAFAMSLMMLTYATFKYSFVDITPMMHHEIVENINMPIIITDQKQRILGCNYVASHEILPFINQNRLTEITSKGNQIDDFTVNQKHFKVNKKVVQRRRLFTFEYKNIYVLHDVSKYCSIRRELERKNQLIKEQNYKLEQKIKILKDTSNIAARNYFAREMHDVIGHALVLSMRLSEAAKIVYNEDPELSEEKIQSARQAVKYGFNEIKNNLSNNVINNLSSISLKREIETIIQKVEKTGLEIKLYFRGVISHMDFIVYETVCRIIKEALTNMLKYSKATTVIISIKLETELTLLFIDNGDGCESLDKGNGIMGIEQRVYGIDGEIDYDYGSGKGFQITVTLPLNKVPIDYGLS